MQYVRLNAPSVGSVGLKQNLTGCNTSKKVYFNLLSNKSS